MVGLFPYQQSARDPHTRTRVPDASAENLDYAMELVQPGSGHYVVLSSRAAFVCKYALGFLYVEPL